jgi:hypothetical protein
MARQLCITCYHITTGLIALSTKLCSDSLTHLILSLNATAVSTGAVLHINMFTRVTLTFLTIHLFSN